MRRWPVRGWGTAFAPSASLLAAAELRTECLLVRAQDHGERDVVVAVRLVPIAPGTPAVGVPVPGVQRQVVAQLPPMSVNAAA